MVILTCARNCLKSIRGDTVKKFGHFGKPLANKSLSTDYTDSLRLKVVGGSGGHGCPVSKAIGGSGGDVIVEASNEVDSLNHVKSAFPGSVAEALNGLDGRNTRRIGPDGTDCIIKVPCGITVLNEFLSPISDLVKEGDKTIVAHGGIGGNIRTNYFGTRGQSQLITLDLRCLADIGLVGYPDSGKSLLWTKLSSISDQKLLPEVTKRPQPKRPRLQYIKYDDGRLISCVDLPSLIEGAHRTEKSGHHWLKHLHHNQIILLVIDVTGFNRGIYRKPIETLLLLNKQIEIYDDRYLTKPTIIVVNKMDLPGADVAFEEFLVSLKSVYSKSTSNNQVEGLDKSIMPDKLIYYQDIIPISCHRNRNINYLKKRIRELIDFNYLKSRNPDCHRSFVSLLETINESRAKVKIQLE